VSTTPAVDLDWAVEEDFSPGPYPPDSEFFFQRVPALIAELATDGEPARVLDVACGFGGQLARLRAPGRESWGLDASIALLQHCRERFEAAADTPLVCAPAESLPFRDGTFDRIVCQGSLDHFVAPHAFLREAARILKPDGRAIIGISNYDSLSCLLGRADHRLKRALGVDVYGGRHYWEIPPNHTFRGTYGLLRRLGAPELELLGCRGASMLWLFRPWSKLMRTLPAPVATSAMRALDRVALRVPAFADLVVSVWRPARAR